MVVGWDYSGSSFKTGATAAYTFTRHKEVIDADQLDNDQVKGPSTKISYSEVQRHQSVADCWVLLNGCVYDVTEFLKIHPGGPHAILAEAGTDASEQFPLLHPSTALATLPPECCIGQIDETTLPEPDSTTSETATKLQTLQTTIPPVETFLLLQDFEDWAQRVLTDTAWAYYRSAADEERTFHENRDAFRRYFFRPRILRDTSYGSTEKSFLGISSSMPVFISPTAMAKLGHPLGEVNLTRAAGEVAVVQMVSSNASCSLEDIVDAQDDDQALMFQLYLNKDRSASEALIRKAERLGFKAIVCTVDVAWESKRTLDVRCKTAMLPPTSTASAGSNTVKNGAGVAQTIGGYQDRNLTWNDIAFIQKNTTLPIISKGVQCVEDSNHGGRQADYAPAPIDLLYEIRVLRPDLFSKIDILIDGGVRCGADVVKALAMGAKAVGVGRPVLYANGTHGEEGVRRVMEILHEEITNTMRNIGARRVEDLRPEIMMVGPAGPWVGGFGLGYARGVGDGEGK
ncbi:L-mandelate dehydrogenase [Aspergillus ellipticus CBS 707.79]|uniref:L-lactate dehydrogenase (cytochrome) n=1 Tax=Aspergillus ellipticus CBS 707.79 TaxID=1448320 RepID=A0A319EMB2_9EURO|nr:L-mandelate dehydrogenase [Aspergillus ellipticus CBS 707.79]